MTTSSTCSVSYPRFRASRLETFGALAAFVTTAPNLLVRSSDTLFPRFVLAATRSSIVVHSSSIRILAGRRIDIKDSSAFNDGWRTGTVVRILVSSSVLTYSTLTAVSLSTAPRLLLNNLLCLLFFVFIFQYVDGRPNGFPLHVVKFDRKKRGASSSAGTAAAELLEEWDSMVLCHAHIRLHS